MKKFLNFAPFKEKVPKFITLQRSSKLSHPSTKQGLTRTYLIQHAEIILSFVSESEHVLSNLPLSTTTRCQQSQRRVHFGFTRLERRRFVLLGTSRILFALNSVHNKLIKNMMLKTTVFFMV